ncbi:MAG: sulfotransferase [Steroidobacteraceae bacterium]
MLTREGVQLSLTLDGLLAEARRRSGIDRADEHAVEPLAVMVKSLNAESRLHVPGAAAMQERLLRLLCNRLRMQRDFAAHPEICQQPISAPIVICGMARTGSTKLHKLLAASGDFNWLPYWQSHNPSLITGSREESPQWRIEDAEAWCKWFDEVSPDTKYGHAMDPHEPDEESYFLEQSLRTACFMGWSAIPGYLQWLYSHDLAAQFRYLKRGLQYLQWQGLQRADRRWILKCPLYYGLEPLLLSVFSDARLVMTHRHPKATVPSSIRLLECFHQPFTAHTADPAALVGGLAAQISQHLQVRAAHRTIQFLDVPFEQIIGDAAALMHKIYAFCGVELRAQSVERVVGWNEANPMNKHGVHKYSLADYGITEQMLEGQFAAYIRLIEALSANDEQRQAGASGHT